MTMESTTRNDSLAARTDTRLAVVAGLVTGTAGYHQNGGTGDDGSGPCKPHQEQSRTSGFAEER